METIVSPGQKVYIPLINYLGFTQQVDKGTEIGTVQPIEVVQPTRKCGHLYQNSLETILKCGV